MRINTCFLIEGPRLVKFLRIDKETYALEDQPSISSLD